VKGFISVTTSSAPSAESLLPVPVPADAPGTGLPSGPKGERAREGAFAQLIDPGDGGAENGPVQLPRETDDGGRKNDDLTTAAQMGLPIALAVSPVPVLIGLATDTTESPATAASVTGETPAPPDTGSGGWASVAVEPALGGVDSKAEGTPGVVVPRVPGPTPGLEQPQTHAPRQASELERPPGPAPESLPDMVRHDPPGTAPVETRAGAAFVTLLQADAEAAAAVAAEQIAMDEDFTLADGAPAVSKHVGPAVSIAPAQDAGTGSANTPASMKMTAKTERNAEPAEQNLPVRQILPETSAQGVEPLTGKAATANAGTRASRLEDAVRADTAAIAVTRGTGSEPVADPSRADELPTPAVDRLAQAITGQVLSLKRAGEHSLDVSMRPDRNTELSLHLTLRDGRVDVMARLERGSIEILQRHWGELQQTLAQQGIRVGQLASSSATGDPTRSQDLQQGFDGQAQRRFEQSPESLDELPLGGAPTEPLHQRARKPTSAMRRGWEMWA
jgi:hypothetical protein